MKDENKTTKELIKELPSLRRHVSKPEKSEAKGNQAQETSEESEQIFRDIFEGVKDAIIYLDKKGFIINANKMAVEIFGGTKEELIGKRFTKIGIFSLKDIPRLMSTFKKILTGREPNIELNVKNKKGNDIYLECTTSLIKTNGKIDGMMIVARDITDRKQAEEKFLRQNEMISNTLESLDHPFYVIDANDYTIKLANSASGIGESTEKSTCYALTHNKTEPCGGRDHPCPLKIVKKTKESVRVEHTHYDRDGNARVHAIHCHPIFDKKGDVAQVIEYSIDVTEHKQAEEELKSERDKLQGIMDGLACIEIGIDIVGIDYRVHFQNHILKERYGDLTGELCYEKYMGLKKPCYFCPMIKAIKSKNVENVELTAVDGKIYELYSAPLTNPDGTVDKAIEVIMDITDRKRAEQGLRESEEKLSSIIEHSNEMFYIHDTNHTLTYVSPYSIEIFGYTPEEMMAKWTKLVTDNAINQIGFELTEKAITTGNKQEPYVLEIMRKDGEMILVEIDESPIKDENGQVIGITGAVRDITERLKKEEVLQDGEERYRRIGTAIIDYIYTVRVEEGRPVETTHGEACFAVTGYTSHEFDTDPYLWIRMVMEEDQNLVREYASHILSGHTLEPIEHRIIRKDGALRWVKNTPVPHYDANGNLLSYDALISDITERKLVENLQHALFRISESVSQTSNFEELLKIIHETLGTLIDTTNLHIALYDAEKDSYSFPYCIDQYEETDFAPQQLRKSLTDYVRRTEKSIIVNEQTHNMLINAGEVELIGRPSPIWLGVPLKTPDGIIGVVVVQSYSDPKAYSEADLDIMTFVSDHIAMAIERKRAEEALRSSEERYRAIWENSPTGISLTDRDGVYHYVNPAYCNTYGYTREQLIGRPFYELIIRPEDKEDRRKSHTEKFEDGKPIPLGEVEFIKSNSEPIWIQFTGDFVKENNAIKYLVSMNIDVTKHRQAQAALKESENRYHELFDSVMEGIGLVDENEIIKFCNPAFARIFEGDSVNDMLGKNLLDYFPQSQKEIILSETVQRKKGESSQYELEIITAKGRKRIIFVSITPRFDDNNDYIGAFGSVLDITETKRLQEFASRAERLETAGRIAGQVAHDFNNLLGPMIAYPDLIRNELSKDHSAVQLLNDIEKAAGTMADINQELLTLSRRGHYTLEIISLNDIITQALDQVEQLSTTLYIETDLDQNLMNIKAGSSQILRVISNLISNARDAMQNKGYLFIKTENYYVDEVSGKFGRVPKGEYVKVTITDTGCGIPEDVLPKIFDPFYTTKTSDRRRGSGLGLSVVNAVIEDHGGYIDIQTKPGQGTSFYLYFPITRESVEMATSDKIIGGAESILVVDDDTLQREVALNLLAKLGYEVTAVERGERAIEYLKENPQDLLVLDMIMPNGIDGAETYQRALEINPEQKAIIVSGYAETERVNLAMKLGAGSFIRKPLTMKVIARAIREELERVLA